MKQNVFLYFLILLFSTSCVSEFRPEIIDPRLPDYSEEGLNTAGAYVDGFPWTSRREVAIGFFFPTGIKAEGDIYIYRSDSTNGNLIAFEYGEQNIADMVRPVTVGFYLANTQIDTPTDFLALEDTALVLDGVTSYGQLFLDPLIYPPRQGPDSLHKGVGMLYIRNVEAVDQSDSVIVSGTFGFDVSIGSKQHTVYSGRFDYKVSPTEIFTIVH